MIDLSISTFLITLLNVGVLFLVLRTVLFKRVTKFMNARTDKVRHIIEEAEKNRQEAKELLSKYEAQLKNVHIDTENIIKGARKKAQQEAAQIIAEGRKSAEILIANAHKQIEEDKDAALVMFRAEAASLVVNASSALIQRELTQEDNRRFAGLLLQEMRKQ